MLKLSLALCIAALVGSASAADITITDTWSRATPAGAASAVVYFTVTDSGAADKLTGASTPVAAKAELHQTTKENGIMKMAPVTSVDVDSSHPFKATPTGYHLMLTGLKQPLKAGDSFPLTLTFAQAGAVATSVIVKPATTVMESMKGMKMDGMDMAH